MSSSNEVIGRVLELRRYPVKSMAGESIEESAVARRLGLVGDRAWALRDVKAGEIRGARKLPAMLDCRARYLEEPAGEESAPIEIDLGSLGSVRSDDPEVSRLISKRLDREMILSPRRPASDLAHYRRANAVTDMEAEIREGSALLPDEPIPDLSDVPTDMASLTQYATPPGTYFDYFDLHLLSTRSLASLGERAPDSLIDPHRFRPNLIVELDGGHGRDGGGGGGSDGGEDPWPEIALVGRTLEVGPARVEVIMPMVRCVMTTHPQQGLPKDPSIMRTLVRESEMSLGVGLSVVEPGRVRVGDAIRLVGG